MSIFIDARESLDWIDDGDEPTAPIYLAFAIVGDGQLRGVGILQDSFDTNLYKRSSLWLHGLTMLI